MKTGQDLVKVLYISWILHRIGAEIRNQDYTRTGQVFKKLDADKDCQNVAAWVRPSVLVAHLCLPVRQLIQRRQKTIHIRFLARS